MRDYAKSYLRPVNIAIGILLSRTSIVRVLQRLLVRNPQVKVAAAWGTASELSDDATFGNDLKSIPGMRKDSLKTMRMKGQKHAFANDIYLHAAIIREALV